jgi:hypothetical protein
MLMGEEFVDKFHKQEAILQLQILKPKASICFASLNIFPRHKALRAMAHLVTSPEESTPAPINSFDNRFRELHSRHEVEGDGA